MWVPPKIIHFDLGFSLMNHPAIGVPQGAMEPPIESYVHDGDQGGEIPRDVGGLGRRHPRHCHLEVSINGGTPKWLVPEGKSY